MSATRLSPTQAAVTRSRVGRSRRRWTVISILAVAVVVLYIASLVIGHIWYSLGDIARVILGHEVEGASYTVGELRLPRASLAVATGLSFGLAGVAFQTMLRNPLASPDIIGISSGASAAAVFAIVFLNLEGTQISALAIIAGLLVALVIYVLSYRDGVAGTRLILIGIGVTAMLESGTTYVYSKAPQWDIQEILRWLSGSLNGASWDDVVPVLVSFIVLGPFLIARAGDLEALQLGDDAAAALGTNVERTRLTVIVAGVGLIAFATAAAGPIAFVAFLSGPIAARLVGPNGSLLIPSALVGATLVLLADLCGQWAFGTRYPVGVVTGVLGAPFLIYLIIRSNRTGGSL